MASPSDGLVFDVSSALRVTLLGVMANLFFAVVKIVTGLAGSSWALVADGIESTADAFTSLVVLVSLRISVRPPDEKHPYGHGRIESLAGLLVSAALFLAAGVIVWHSIQEILVPQQAPEWFTLPVLVAVILGKLYLSRLIGESGKLHGSSAMLRDSWHHAADAITSFAALIGISIALWGGPGWESADDWAALVACAVIAVNALLLLRGSVDEMMDSAVPEPLEMVLRDIACAVEGVRAVEKCRIRKSGLGFLMDIHVEVDGGLTVTEGHDIAGAVKGALLGSDRNVVDVTVHVEPH